MDEKKPKKKGGIGRIIGRILLIVFILFVALVAFARYSATKSQREYEAKEKTELHSSLNWPTNTTVAKMLPKPDSDVGRINWEHDDSISVEIPDVSTDDFNNYINKCSDAGFNVDFSKSDVSYYANSTDGYHLSLFLGDDNVMAIGLSKLNNEADNSSDTSTIEETVVPTEAPAEESSTTEASTDSNSIRPDIKEAIDSYETFMNDYCDFMTKYSESDDVVSMMADYADYMSKYTDMTKKFDDLENDNLNDAELSYYLEVQTRITQKLANVPTN